MVLNIAMHGNINMHGNMGMHAKEICSGSLRISEHSELTTSQENYRYNTAQHFLSDCGTSPLPFYSFLPVQMVVLTHAVMYVMILHA